MTEVIKTIKSRTVCGLAHFKLLPFLEKLQPFIFLERIKKAINGGAEGGIVGGQPDGVVLGHHIFADILFQIVDILLVVESAHLLLVSIASMVDIQFAVQACRGNERVSHGDALWLHGVVFRVTELPERRVIEIGHTPAR